MRKKSLESADSSEKSRGDSWSINNIILSYAKKDAALVTGYIVLIAISTTLGLVGTTKATSALYASAARGDRQNCFKWLALSLALAIVLGAVQWGTEYVENVLDVEFTKYVLKQAVGSVFDANHVSFLDLGPMQYRAFVRTSADSSREVFKQVVKAYAPNIVLIVILLVFLFYLEWKYGAVFLTGMAVVAAMFALNYKPMIKSCRRVEAHLRGADFRTFDVLQAMPTVVSAGQSHAEQVSVGQVTADAMQVRLDVTQAMVANNTTLSTFLVVSTMVVMLMAVWSMKDKDSPDFTAAGATKVVTILTLMASLQARFQTVNSSNERVSEQTGRFEASVLPQVTGAHALSTSGTKLLCGNGCACLTPNPITAPSSLPQPLPSSSPQSLPLSLRCRCPLTIEFDGVSFAYSSTAAAGEIANAKNADRRASAGASAGTITARGRDVLHKFSWTFGPGGVSCLRAPSGTGKTTLAKLLVGMHEPHEGVIRVNGIDIREVDHSDLRCRIAFTNQDQPLLNRTIDEVIRYGAPNATEQQVEAVWQRIRGAFAGKTRETRVGKMGKSCSTGMRQLLRFANIELRGAGCVVADEPCNGLDAVNKKLVVDSLKALAENGTTVLIITHDEDTASIATNVKYMVATP